MTGPMFPSVHALSMSEVVKRVRTGDREFKDALLATEWADRPHWLACHASVAFDTVDDWSAVWRRLPQLWLNRLTAVVIHRLNHGNARPLVKILQQLDPSEAARFHRRLVSDALEGVHLRALEQLSVSGLVPPTYPDGLSADIVRMEEWISIARAPEKHQIALSDWLVAHAPSALASFLASLRCTPLMSYGCWALMDHLYPQLDLSQQRAWAQVGIATCWIKGQAKWVDRLLPHLESSLDEGESPGALAQLLEIALDTPGPVAAAYADRIWRAMGARPDLRARHLLAVALDHRREDWAAQILQEQPWEQMPPASRQEAVLVALRTEQKAWLDRLLPGRAGVDLWTAEDQVGWITESMLAIPDTLPWLTHRVDWDLLERAWSTDLPDSALRLRVIDWVATQSPAEVRQRWLDRFPEQLPMAARRAQAEARSTAAQDQGPTRSRLSRPRT